MENSMKVFFTEIFALYKKNKKFFLINKKLDTIIPIEETLYFMLNQIILNGEMDSEIAFIIGIAVIMIDTFFPPEETKVNCVWKIILIAVSIVCMLYFAKKVKTVNEVEEEKKFWPNFFIQWATSLGYINMPVAVIAILVTFDKGKAWTLFMMGVAVILTGLTLIEALVKTSKILKKENVGKRK